MATNASTIYNGIPVKAGLRAANIAGPGAVFKDVAKTIPAVADSDLVYAVADLTGNGHDMLAVNEAGVYNVPALVKNSQGGQYGLLSNFNGALQNRLPHLKMVDTAFLTNPAGYTIVLVNKVSTNGPPGCMLGSDNARYRLYAARGTTEGASLTLGINQAVFGGRLDVPNNSPVVLALSVSYSEFAGGNQPKDATYLLRLNGKRWENRGYGIDRATTPSSIYFNAVDDAGNGGHHGAVFQCQLIYEGGLTEAQLKELSDYFSTTYSIPTTDVPVPTYSPDAQVIYEGDSISYGQSAIALAANMSGFPARSIALLKQSKGQDYKYYILGIPAQGMGSIKANAAARVDALYDVSKTVNIIHLFAGTNDFAFNANTNPSSSVCRL
jgi:hypothetical protein